MKTLFILLFAISTQAQILTVLGEHANITSEAPASPQEYMVAIWAEENSTLGANTYEWAYGNGANSPQDGGVTIYVPDGWECHVVAMTLRLGSGSATVELLINGVLQDCNVVSDGQSTTNSSFTALELSNNDYINFRTTTASGTSSPNVVCVWLRYREL